MIISTTTITAATENAHLEANNIWGDADLEYIPATMKQLYASRVIIIEQVLMHR